MARPELVEAASLTVVSETGAGAGVGGVGAGALGRRLFSPRVGVLVATLVAGYPLFIYQGTQVSASNAIPAAFFSLSRYRMPIDLMLLLFIAGRLGSTEPGRSVAGQAGEASGLVASGS
jgi:hypothetical protein